MRRRKSGMLGDSPAIHYLFCLLVSCAAKETSTERPPRIPEPVKFYHFMGQTDYREICHDGITSHLATSHLKDDLPTFVIIDGFLSSLKTNMTVHIKNALLAPGMNKSNVIVVEWCELSGYNELEITADTTFAEVMIEYNVVQTKVSLVGKKLGKFLGSLSAADVADFSRMHLIGYSLGAHIAGVAGHFIYKKYNERVARITGLDPAGPGFSMKDKDHRLDKSDANFVDIYYTNRYRAGDTAQKVGHVDVYVNGGKAQPGCESKSLANSTMCSHGFSWKVWNYCLKEECDACHCATNECDEDGSECHGENSIMVGMEIPIEGLLFGNTEIPFGPVVGSSENFIIQVKDTNPY